MSKPIDLSKQYADCPLFERVLPVFTGKHKSKTAMHAALADLLNYCLQPYGLCFMSDKVSVYCGCNYEHSNGSREVVLEIKGNGPDYTLYTDLTTPQDAAARLCARIAVVAEDLLFWGQRPFSPAERTDFNTAGLPALAKRTRERHLFVVDAANKIALLEVVLPVPDRLHSNVNTALARIGVLDTVDVKRLTTPLTAVEQNQYFYSLRTEGFGQATAHYALGAFKVSDDLKTRWLSTSSWSERLTMYYVLERLYMQAYTASLTALVTAMIPSVCPLEDVNPPRHTDESLRRSEQARVREFAEFVYHNARPPVQSLEEYTRTILDGTAAMNRT